jgi:CPA2 family monovalent cation:H+ antiporter-2
MASLVATIFHYIKLPPVVGFLLSGILIGPGSFAWIKDPINTHALTETVAVLLMFTIGLEFSIKKLKKYSQHFLKLGLLQVVLSIIYFFLVSYFGLSTSIEKAIFYSFALSLSSTAVVFKILIENSEMESSHGQASTSILLFQDLAIIPMMLLLPLLGETGPSLFDMQSLLIFAGKSIGVLALIYFGSEYIIPIVLEKVAKTKNQEIFFFSILFLCIATAYLMGAIGFSYSLGAFIAGLLVSDSAYGKQALSDFLPFRDILLGVFFVNIGMLLDVNFLMENFIPILRFGIGFILVKSIIIYGIVWFWTSSHAIAAICGLLLSQSGEFGFLLFEEGVKLKIVDSQEMQFFIAASVISLSLTPFLYKLASRLSYNEQYSKVLPEQFTRVAKSLRKSLVQRLGNDLRFDNADNEKLNGHTIIIGFGPTGQSVARVLTELSIPYQVIELNPSTVKNAKADNNIIYGDATKTEILEKAGIHNAKLLVITIPGTKAIDAISIRAHHMRPDLPLIVRTQYLKQVDEISKNSNTDFVVGEFETSIEVLIRVLKNYGVESSDINNFVGSTRKFVHDLSMESFHFQKNEQRHSHWEIFNNIRPLVIKEDIHETGKSLSELNIRKMTGASVIAVYREDRGTSHPHPDYVIEAGDVLYVLGNSEHVEMLSNYLSEGSELLAGHSQDS